MAQAFVTGGSGFVGGALIERLRREGWQVRALARSDEAAEAVRERGAEEARGDLDDTDALAEAAEGCEVCFHSAAKTGDFGDPEEFEQANVVGTRNVIDACRTAGVRRLVHVGTEAALMKGQPLVNVDERTPLQPDSPSLYPATKARAEQAVRQANGEKLETVVIRPRFVWGRGDQTVTPALIAMVEAGRFRWIDGGRHLTDTSHIDNTVEGLWLGATKARPGTVYFVTDGDPVTFRDFITRLLEAHGVTPPDKSVPLRVAKLAAASAETVWSSMSRPGNPPITRFAVWASGIECTIDDSRAREELGYAPVKTRDEGFAELG